MKSVGAGPAEGPLKVITVRNVPDDLYRTLARLAERNRRSLQQQVLVLLEQARVYDRDSPVERARAMRRRFAGRALGDTVAEVRAERER
ncbi:hypothetical protein L6R50_01730 [Myxococcota bacterium]|nr:hypothetical protein [Myxococcota bacterium]